MSDLGTFEINENKLENTTLKLKQDIKHLEEKISMLKDLEKQEDKNVNECIEVIENTLIPILNKYGKTTELMVLETKNNKLETIN